MEPQAANRQLFGARWPSRVLGSMTDSEVAGSGQAGFVGRARARACP